MTFNKKKRRRRRHWTLIFAGRMLSYRQFYFWLAINICPCCLWGIYTETRNYINGCRIQKFLTQCVSYFVHLLVYNFVVVMCVAIILRNKHNEKRDTHFPTFTFYEYIQKAWNQRVKWNLLNEYIMQSRNFVSL